MKWILLTISVLTFFACNSTETTEEATTDTTAQTEETTAEESSDDGIQLNNGEKWAVNAEMKPFIEKGNEILSEYVAANSEDYKALAEALKEQNMSLIKSCTMKGKSHEELHKWLYPHMEAIEQLANASDAEAAKGYVAQLEKSFEQYNAYFK